MIVRIADIAGFDGKEVTIQGWAANVRSSGKIAFLQLRDGSAGLLQAVVSHEVVGEAVFSSAKAVTIESSVIVTGTVKAESRSPGGFELQATNVELVQKAEEYPIGKKEHGQSFCTTTVTSGFARRSKPQSSASATPSSGHSGSSSATKVSS